MTGPHTKPPSSSIPSKALAWRSLGLLLFGLGSVLVGVFAGPRILDAWDRLVPEVAAESAVVDEETTTNEPAQAGVQWYQSQMHPWIIQPFPGQCPVCGMDLTPIDPSRFGAELTISPLKVQQIGIRSEPVQQGALQHVVRAVGVVEYDHARHYDITLRSDAWIEDLTVYDIGDRVEKGQRLFHKVSEELYASQVEYFQTPKDSRLRAAVVRRMRYLGIDSTDLLDQAGEPLEALPVFSPVDGIVVSEPPAQGKRLRSGDSVLGIVDDRQLLVSVTLLQGQDVDLKVGLPVEVEFMPSGQRASAEVTHIEPSLNPMTLGVQVDIRLPNPDRRIKIGSFVNVHMTFPMGENVLRIPRSSVVDSGNRRMVFVSLGRGRFEPREVEIGFEDSAGYVAVRSGLAEGESVVTSGQFLIDAESRMMESLARTMNPTASVEKKQRAQTTSIRVPDKAEDAATLALLEAYQSLSQSLYVRDFTAAQSAHAQLREEVNAHPQSNLLASVVAEIGASLQEDGAWRQSFGQLGVLLRDIIRDQGLVVGSQWQVVTCGMAPAPEDGVWLQDNDAEIQNPFFGARHGMRSCHTEVVPLVLGDEEAP